MREMVNPATGRHPTPWLRQQDGLTVLWKSSIVNSVKPWDTRSSLLLADTALNLAAGGREGRGLLSQQRGPA